MAYGLLETLPLRNTHQREREPPRDRMLRVAENDIELVAQQLLDVVLAQADLRRGSAVAREAKADRRTDRGVGVADDHARRAVEQLEELDPLGDALGRV